MKPADVLAVLVTAQKKESEAALQGSRRAMQRVDLALAISADLEAAGFSEEDNERVIGVLFRGRFDLVDRGEAAGGEHYSLGVIATEGKLWVNGRATDLQHPAVMVRVAEDGGWFETAAGLLENGEDPEQWIAQAVEELSSEAG